MCSLDIYIRRLGGLPSFELSKFICEVEGCVALCTYWTLVRVVLCVSHVGSRESVHEMLRISVTLRCVTSFSNSFPGLNFNSTTASIRLTCTGPHPAQHSTLNLTSKGADILVSPTSHCGPPSPYSMNPQSHGMRLMSQPAAFH